MTDWLILADDLTGAADCAIAFAKGGLATAVAWNEAIQGDLPVLSIDVDSRRLSAEAAAERQVRAQGAHHQAGARLYKKIDSTLRGQPAAELAAQMKALPPGPAPLAVVAPAFPATGRVTLDGRVVVNGQALEATPIWARDHSYADGDLASILEAAGMATAVVALDTVRAGAPAVLARLARARAEGKAAVVCDAATEQDLDTVAAASLAFDHVVWVGSAGLAAALARQVCPGRTGLPALPPMAGGVLVVVGSLAEASRLQAAQVLRHGAAQGLSVASGTLLAGPRDPAWLAVAAELQARMAQGADVLLEVAAEACPDLAQGPALAERLAELLAASGPALGALVATGGETACALLGRLGVHGIELMDEIEPGVPFGLTLGARRFPVVTKAGGFGDALTLERCLARLKN
jgi:uncharacterized protein YgbK (DUF1537 family)